MELRELHTQVFRGDECPRPRTREILVKYPPMELGGLEVTKLALQYRKNKPR